MLAVGKRLQKRLDSTEANLNLSLNGAIIEQVKSHKLLSGQHLRLQNRAARVTLNALFNTLMYKKYTLMDSILQGVENINRCALIHKRLEGNTSNYMNELLVTNSSMHMRNMDIVI